jgi:hypothetical protein
MTKPIDLSALQYEWAQSVDVLHCGDWHEATPAIYPGHEAEVRRDRTVIYLGACKTGYTLRVGTIYLEQDIAGLQESMEAAEHAVDLVEMMLSFAAQPNPVEEAEAE